MNPENAADLSGLRTPLSAIESAELDAMIEECKADAALPPSPWEPACIAAAFATKSPLRISYAFTMQAWIDLEAIRSRLLLFEPPATALEFYRALLIFDVLEKPGEELKPEEMLAIGNAMADAVRDAFAMSLPMLARGERGEEAEEGFGKWLPIFACLKTQCGYGHAEALALDVGQAFAVIAGMRRNDGWQCAGEPYAARDAADSRLLTPDSPEGETNG